MKKIGIVILVLFCLFLIFYKGGVSLSYYTDPETCSKPGTSYQDGYRCYADENKKSFNLNIVNCDACGNNKGTWSNDVK